ncbi:50S ribosomal protein L18 [Candidatus Woesearchaeota archaeon]|nr:50S ribosomal protein L18 [Candidatus Woesearchaeota archaeon]
MGTTYKVAYRRTRQGRTDYKKRLLMLKTQQPRLVVRKSIKHVLAQVVQYYDNGDKVIASAHTRELAKLGWDAPTGNLPAAYLCGALLAKKAKVKTAILDSGFQAHVPGSRIYAVVKGCVENGLQVPVAKEVLPSEDRVAGKHIAAHTKNAHLPDLFSKVRKSLT